MSRFFLRISVYLQVFVIGQDFGAMVAYKFVLEYPERVLGVATLGVPFMPPGPFTSHKTLPEGFYISRWNVCSFIKPFISI